MGMIINKDQTEINVWLKDTDGSLVFNEPGHIKDASDMCKIMRKLFKMVDHLK